MAMYGVIIAVCISVLLSDAADISGLLVSHPEDHSDLNLHPTLGSAPSWLSGTLYRTGPGLYEHGGRSVNNVMDGLSKVHAWHFPGDGSVSYTATMLKSGVYNKTMDDGYYAAFPIMGDITPDFTMAEELEMMFGDIAAKDNTNIAIWNLDGGKSVTVTTESPVMNQVVPRTLQYKSPLISPVVDQLSSTKQALFSATHYAKHPSDGSSFNYVATMSMLPWKMHTAHYEFYQYYENSKGVLETKKIASIPVSITDLRLIHQFGITENFLFVPRFNFNMAPSLSFLYDMSHMCHALKFVEDKPTYMDIISIKSGKIFSFEMPPTRVAHIMNAFERTNSKGELEVVLDIPTTDYPDKTKDEPKHCLFDIYKIPLINKEGYQYDNVAWNTTLKRVVYNMATRKNSVQEFPQTWRPIDTLVEFPFINQHFVGRDYCYCYFMQWHMKTMSMDLLKYDVCKQTSTSWREKGKHIMEPVFVANPGSPDIMAEDDGVIISPVFDSSNNSTELIVWDARNLTVIARYDNLVNVPITIHGWWFENKTE